MTETPPWPTSARAVVIGAGIVGNSLAGHLAELGWTDLVLLDKGPLPNPGGSTGHASNFIFPVDHNKEMAMLTLDSQRQYTEMGLNVARGGVETAREPQRREAMRGDSSRLASSAAMVALITRGEISLRGNSSRLPVSSSTKS